MKPKPNHSMWHWEIYNPRTGKTYVTLHRFYPEWIVNAATVVLEMGLRRIVPIGLDYERVYHL